MCGVWRLKTKGYRDELQSVECRHHIGADNIHPGEDIQKQLEKQSWLGEENQGQSLEAPTQYLDCLPLDLTSYRVCMHTVIGS